MMWNALDPKFVRGSRPSGIGGRVRVHMWTSQIWLGAASRQPLLIPWLRRAFAKQERKMIGRIPRGGVLVLFAVGVLAGSALSAGAETLVEFSSEARF